jgi:beta-barrel assembly-enhancing protease
MTGRLLPHPYRQVLAAWLVTAMVSIASAQTAITLDKNKYSPAQDVQLGREAAAEVRRELPMLGDDRVERYVERIGRDLVEAIPSQYSHDGFDYTFDVVNQREINAFALPGGPMFLNRGMLEAARSEGEIAGVMAHEIAHVALRHGTAQATKGQKFQIGAIAGQVLGAIVGGTAGSVIAQGSSFGLGTYFLKYGREYERQADLLGAQIMARAGYDPRRMADMFQTIEQQSGGSGGPEWMSSHPNPGNRRELILREASSLRVEGNLPSASEFNAVQSRLDGMSPAYTAEQIARAKASGERVPSSTNRRDSEPVRARTGRVDFPASDMQRVQVGDFLRVQVPSNWRQATDSNSVTFAPDGAHYRGNNGETGFTHGVQIGVVPSQSRNQRQATDALLESLLRGNPQIRRQANGYSRGVIGGRNALSTTLRNVSATGEPELVSISTLPLDNEHLMYIIDVVPQHDADAYASAFRRIKQSVQLAGRDTSR